MKKKAFACMLCIVLLYLAGCGKNKDMIGVGNRTTEQDIVTLKWYMSVDSISPDTQMVIDELNRYTREKIGVEIDYHVTANTDYEQKMPIYINAGEYFDICFTSSWSTNYTQFVSKEAFMDITELLPEYARETYEFIPQVLWEGILVDGRIYGIPSYKELGWQGGLLVNTDMAGQYGVDLSKVRSIQDYEEVLKTVKEKADAEGRDMILLTGLAGHQGFTLTNPYESLIGSQSLPGAARVEAYNNFLSQTEEVFNQYATPEYEEYCRMARRFYLSGYLPTDPVKYDNDTTGRDSDFQTGKLFSYLIPYAPGAAEALEVKTGHGVTFIPLMDPLFETRNSMGGILSLSAGCEHPEKALEFINLLNTDVYVGTLMRHGIEGIHYVPAGEGRVDKTMNGTLPAEESRYDYSYGWKFGTPFNQKWDISYPEDIIEQFGRYNRSANRAPHLGFSFNTSKADVVTAALGKVVEEFGPVLETGIVDPEVNIPKFLEALESCGVESLLQEIRIQLQEYRLKNKFFTREIWVCALLDTNSLCAKSSAEMGIKMKKEGGML